MEGNVQHGKSWWSVREGYRCSEIFEVCDPGVLEFGYHI